MVDKKKPAKKATKKPANMVFPTLVYGLLREDFLEETEFPRFYEGDTLNAYLEDGERTLVAVYELVGTEYRTKKLTVDIEDVV